MPRNICGHILLPLLLILAVLEQLTVLQVCVLLARFRSPIMHYIHVLVDLEEHMSPQYCLRQFEPDTNTPTDFQVLGDPYIYDGGPVGVLVSVTTRESYLPLVMESATLI